MPNQTPDLRDLHLPNAPSFWPLAPGWWWVIGIVVFLLISITAYKLWRKARRQRWLKAFDAACTVGDQQQRITAIFEMLRRAAKRIDSRYATLEGLAWIRFLDGKKTALFSADLGEWVIDAAFRRDISEQQVDALYHVARRRFIELMERRE